MPNRGDESIPGQTTLIRAGWGSLLSTYLDAAISPTVRRGGDTAAATEELIIANVSDITGRISTRVKRNDMGEGGRDSVHLDDIAAVSSHFAIYLNLPIKPARQGGAPSQNSGDRGFGPPPLAIPP